MSKTVQEHNDNNATVQNPGNCHPPWKYVRDSAASPPIPTSRLFDRLGEEVEAQISFPLFCCLVKSANRIHLDKVKDSPFNVELSE